jgi:hypothetical protein
VQPLDLLLRDILHVQDDQLNHAFALIATKEPWTYSTVRALLQAYRDVIDRHIDMLLRQPMDLLFTAKRGGQ